MADNFNVVGASGALVTIASKDVGAGVQATYHRITDGSGHYMPAADATTRALYAIVTDGTNTMPTGDAAARKIYVTLTDGTGTATFDNSNTTPKVSNYGKGTAAGDTAMPSLDTAGHAGYFIPTDGTRSATIKAGSTLIAVTDTTIAVQNLPSDGVNLFKSASLATLQANTHQNAQLVAGPGETVATASIVTGTATPAASMLGAGAATIWVVRWISISLAAVANQVPLLFELVQDAAGTPVILWQGSLAALANTSAGKDLLNLNIPQTVANKTLTLSVIAGTIVSGNYIQVSFGATKAT